MAATRARAMFPRGATGASERPRASLREIAASALADADREAVAQALRASRAPATLRAYRSQLRAFVAWAKKRGLRAWPADPETVAAYAVARAEAGASASTVGQAMAAIRAAHRDGGREDPTAHEGVRATLAGLRRMGAGRQPRQARPIDAEALAAIVATAPATAAGRFDVALVRTMRDGLLRRGEAAALRWRDVERAPDGSGRVTVRRSKTDPEGEGATLYVAPATVEALEAMREDRPPAERQGGALVFGRSGRTLARRLAAAAERAGLGPGYGGHSPRVGMAVDLVRGGASMAATMVAGRWASATMPARYARAELAARGAVARWYGRGREAAGNS